MSVKSWNVKLVLDRPENRAILERNLQVWNDGCRDICLSLLALRRGDAGETGKAAWVYLAEKSKNWHMAYCLSGEFTPRKESDDVKRKLQISNDFKQFNGGPDARLMKARLNLGPYWQQAITAAVERVKSYEAKLEIWNSEHVNWLERRKEWEAENTSFMTLRPIVESFQAKEGASRGSRVRWHKWITFLTSEPAVVRWQDSNAQFLGLTDEERKQVRKGSKYAVRKERDLLFKKNPQLDHFDRLHGYYEKEFSRTYAKRKHPDGFRQRPTFTLPSLPKRPEWVRFKKNDSWKAEEIAERLIKLRVLNADGKPCWVTFKFVPDPRVDSLRKLEQPIKIGSILFEYSTLDRSGRSTYAQPQGIKLIQRPGGWFMSITFTIVRVATKFPQDQKKVSKYSYGWTLKTFREANAETAIVTCAIDLALRHLGALTIAREGDVFARRILHNRVQSPGSESVVNIPSLAEIAAVKRRLAKMRHQSGRMSPKKLSCHRMQTHYRHMQEDRYKKAASAVCQYAAFYGADFLIFEDLKRLVPDSQNERGINSALSAWNRGAIVDFATKIAEDFGLRVVTVPSYHTSKMCSKCGELGVRFDVGTKRPFRKPKSEFTITDSDRCAVSLAKLGHWFFCPACRHRVHADLNASENLHRVFLGLFPTVRSDGPGKLLVNGASVLYADVETKATSMLHMKSLKDLPF